MREKDENRKVRLRDRDQDGGRETYGRAGVLRSHLPDVTRVSPKASGRYPGASCVMAASDDRTARRGFRTCRYPSARRWNPRPLVHRGVGVVERWSHVPMLRRRHVPRQNDDAATTVSRTMAALDHGCRDPGWRRRTGTAVVSRRVRRHRAAGQSSSSCSASMAWKISAPAIAAVANARPRAIRSGSRQIGRSSNRSVSRS